MENTDRVYIGLTGLMASGKGEIVKILKGKGFLAISLSDIVREEVNRSHATVSRTQMQDTGNRLRETEGPGALAKRVRGKIENHLHPRWVIDGIRNPAEVLELRGLQPFYLLAIQSERSLILDRIRCRARPTDIAADTELNRRLDREWGVGEPEHGQHVGKCVELADFTIDNNESLNKLCSGMLKILKTIGVNHEQQGGSLSRLL